MVCSKGDPKQPCSVLSGALSGVFSHAPLTFCELSEGTLQTKFQVLADKPWKINTWHGRTAMYLAMGAHSATPLICEISTWGAGNQLPFTSSEIRKQMPPATPRRANVRLKERCALSKPSSEERRSNDGKYMSYGQTKEVVIFIIPKISDEKTSEQIKEKPQSSSSSRHLKGENINPQDCSSANFSLPESWSMKLV